MRFCVRCDRPYRRSLYGEFCGERCQILKDVPTSRDRSQKNPAKVYRNCDWCGKEFLLRASLEANTLFCSDACCRKLKNKKYIFLYDVLQVLRAKGPLSPSEIAWEMSQNLDWALNTHRVGGKMKFIPKGFIYKQGKTYHAYPNLFPLQQHLG